MNPATCGLREPWRKPAIGSHLDSTGSRGSRSQFFITVAATPWLTGNHTIFGEVVEGQDIADKISKVKKGAQDRPVKEVVINSITIERTA